MKKRIGIYATYDKDGYIEGYVSYCLEQLSKVTDYLVVVSNKKLADTEKAKLSMASRIYERSDDGYDMGGFAHVINDMIQEKEWQEYGEIVFMNDSVFGPFYPFSELFEEMQQRPELDFWGITKRGNCDFDGGETIYPEHIQIYFYVVKEKMMHSPEFADYWKSITEKVTDFRSAIINYEFAFTKYFQDRGYQWEVLCNIPKYCTQNPKLNLSPYHYSSYEMIKNQKCPLIKRKLFTGDFVEGKYTDKMDLERAFDYIHRNTDYDIDLIWAHILRVYPLGEIMDSLHLYQIMDANGAGNNRKKEQIQVLDLSMIHCGKLDSQLFPYCLVIKISTEEGHAESLKEANIRCVMENLFAGENYVSNMIRLFQTSPRLGILIPPIKLFGAIKCSIERVWADSNQAERLYQKLKLHVPFQVERAPVYKIDAFCCRSQLLNENLISELKQDSTGAMMQMITLVAQEAGYYTKVMLNERYIPGLLSNMQRMTRDIWEMADSGRIEDADLDGMKEEIYRKKLSSFCRNKKKIYVYGAGQLACRMIPVIREFTHIGGVVVSDKNGNSDTICGYPVRGIEELKLDEENIGFVVTVGKKNNKVIENILIKLQIEAYLLLT